MSHVFHRLFGGHHEPGADDNNGGGDNDDIDLFTASAKPDEKTHLLRAERKLFRSLRGASISRQNSDEDTADAVIGSKHDELVESAAVAGGSGRSLGTFQGVFAPVSLSMLSSILFLRVGYIVGNAGFLETLLLLGIAYSILVATVLSICAIATNGAVEGGGVYFMISRTLGMEFGGSIGILFWFANIVSSALYLAACTEGIVGSFGPVGNLLPDAVPDGKWWRFLYASVVNLLNLTVCLVGSKMFGKTSAIVLAIVVACSVTTMGSFFADDGFEKTYVYNVTSDCVPPTDNVSLPNCTKAASGVFVGLAAASAASLGNIFSDNLMPKYEFDCSDVGAEVSFFTVFGVLFSGVTGIMSGKCVQDWRREE